MLLDSPLSERPIVDTMTLGFVLRDANVTLFHGFRVFYLGLYPLKVTAAKL